jgi:hypothetical protein
MLGNGLFARQRLGKQIPVATKTSNNGIIVGCAISYAVRILSMKDVRFFLPITSYMQCECTAMRYMAFIDFQNPADLERVQVRGLSTEMCPASSHDAYQAISIKAELPSEAEAEEDPLAVTFQGGIKAEPEVSCVSVSMLEGFHKYK